MEDHEEGAGGPVFGLERSAVRVERDDLRCGDLLPVDDRDDIRCSARTDDQGKCRGRERPSHSSVNMHPRRP